MGLADRRSDYDWGTLEREDLDNEPIQRVGAQGARRSMIHGASIESRR